MEEHRKREAILYGRLELLAMEACVHYKMKDKAAAFATLTAAYEMAVPNDLIMPFIWMGKDMRMVIAAALRESNYGIPRPWLEMIGRRAATYAKRHTLFLSGYKKAHGVDDGTALSPRECDVLRDMYNGLSRSEIAVSQNLSINTIKMIINSIYEKLNANNIVDVVRIAAERKLV
jgi:LuxR family maltose regulon positive regulatory protein